jgi:hypothetical protein
MRARVPAGIIGRYRIDVEFRPPSPGQSTSLPLPAVTKNQETGAGAQTTKAHGIALVPLLRTCLTGTSLGLWLLARSTPMAAAINCDLATQVPYFGDQQNRSSKYHDEYPADHEYR